MKKKFIVHGELFWWLGVLIVAAILCPVTSALALDVPVGKLQVRSTTTYRLQWSNAPNSDLVADEASDQDIEELLGVDWSLEDKGLSFSYLGKYTKDIDGTASGSIFQDYQDVRDNTVSSYYAYLEKDDLLPGIDVRLGRQYVYSAETVHFDGAWARADRLFKKWFSMEVFGGRVVQMYSNLSQDGIGGVNLEFHPMKELAIHLDSVFYLENSFEASVYWRPVDWIKTNARWSFIDKHSRDASIDVVTEVKATGTTIGLNLYRRFEIAQHTKDDFIYDYTYSAGDYNNIRRLYLSRQRAYLQYTISVSQPIPTQKGLSAFVRYTHRDMAHDAQEDLYTTNFHSCTLGLSMDEWLGLKGFHMSSGFTTWWEKRTKLYETKSRSVFVDLSQKLFKKWEIGAGCYYKTEDINSLIQSEAAEHYYGSVRYALDENKWAELKYEYEHDDYYRDVGAGDINALTARVYVRC